MTVYLHVCVHMHVCIQVFEERKGIITPVELGMDPCLLGKTTA